MSANLIAYLQGLFCFDAVVQRSDPTLWENPSPCERWTARAVVNHNAMVCVMITEMTRGNPAAVPEGTAERAYAAPSQDGFVLAPHVVQRYVGRDDDPVAVWNRKRDDVLEALDQPGALLVESRSPWGASTVDAYLGLAFFDPLIHAWDLAKAVGQEPVLDANLAQRALDYLTQFDRTQQLRQPGVLAAPLHTTRQDPVTQLLAFSGRQP